MKVTDLRFQAVLKKIHPIDNRAPEDTEISNTVKTFTKRWPWFYNFLKHAVGPSHSPGSRYRRKKRIRDFMGDTPNIKMVLNLGSGTYRIHPEVINVDIFPFKEVDLVADVCALPLRDDIIDGVVCEDVLEHVADAPLLLKEISRVLKPGGMLFIKIPFLYPYHSSPDDFSRWTESGIRHDLEKNGFRIVESGSTGGPMGTLQAVLMHIFSIMFSFNSKTLYFFLVQFFMVVLSPLKLLDPLFMLSSFSSEVSNDLFVIAEKRG